MFGNLVMKRAKDAGPLLCPSAHTAAPGARLFGVQVRTEGGERQLAYLTETHPITEKVMKLAGSAAPHEVLRVAAHCIEGQCPHWNGEGCRLATRVATMLPPAVSALPRCAIRPRCLCSSRRDRRHACGARRLRRSISIRPMRLVRRWRNWNCRRMMSFCSRIAPDSLFLNGSGTAAGDPEPTLPSDQRGE
jgi:hypothetical protein